jgi:hypothetical protein
MFVLRRFAEKLLVETSSDSQQIRYKGIVCSEGQTLHSTHLIAHLSHLPLYIDTTKQKYANSFVMMFISSREREREREGGREREREREGEKKERIFSNEV